MFSNCSMICLPAVHVVSIGISYCATLFTAFATILLQLAWIMLEFIPSFCIRMLPVTNGLWEVC